MDKDIKNKLLEEAKQEAILRFKRYIPIKEIKHMKVINIEHVKDVFVDNNMKGFRGDLIINNIISIPFKLTVILIDEDDLGYGLIKNSKIDLNFDNIIVLRNEEKVKVSIKEQNFKNFLKETLIDNSEDNNIDFKLIEDVLIEFKEVAKEYNNNFKSNKAKSFDKSYEYIVDKLLISLKKNKVNLHHTSNMKLIKSYGGTEYKDNYIYLEYISDKTNKKNIDSELIIYLKLDSKKIKMTFNETKGYHEEEFIKLKSGARNKLNLLNKGIILK